jgi:hypothetical protein
MGDCTAVGFVSKIVATVATPLVGAGIAMIISRNMTITVLVFILCLLIPLVILSTPLKRTWVDWTRELDEDPRYTLISEGVWTRVYLDTTTNNVIKQLYAPGYGHTDYSHLKNVPFWGSRICGETCTTGLYMFHMTAIKYQMINWIRRQEINGVPGLPEIISIDKVKGRCVMEYVPHVFGPNNCPPDAHAQLLALNATLTERGLVLDDVHAQNLRIAADGVTIKCIDGELYTDAEYRIQSRIINMLDTQVTATIPAADGCDRIIYWEGERIGPEDAIAAAVGRYPKRTKSEVDRAFHEHV